MARKILRINMTDLSYAYEDIPEKWARWAGRGLTSAIVFGEVDPQVHPLGPHNKVVVAPGWVTGTPAAPSSGRTSFGGKSPLTGGIKESNAGGLSGQKIAKLGLAAIVLEASLPRVNGTPWWSPKTGCSSRTQPAWWARGCMRSMSCCGKNIPRQQSSGLARRAN